MVLFMIGLGLGDEKDITVKGLEAVKSCKRVFLEHYTAIIGVSVERLAEYYGVPITLADRECVESESDQILKGADKENVAFLVVGDVFAATTHSDLMLRAVEMNIPVRVIHNASIMNAVSACGLQLYTFGHTVSICFFDREYRPDSFYDFVLSNKKAGLHTLCLLDIKVKEQSRENMAKGNKDYLPPRYMTVNQCIEQLLEVEEKKQGGAYSKDTICVGLSRVGQETQQIVSGTMQELLKIDFGAPLHSFVIPGELHFLEGAMLDHHHWDRTNRMKFRKEQLQKEETERQDAASVVAAERAKAKVEREAAFAQKKAHEAEQKEQKVEHEKQQIAVSVPGDDDSEGEAVGEGVDMEGLFDTLPPTP